MSTNAITTITVFHDSGVAPADVARRLALSTGKPREEADALSAFFGGAGVRNSKINVRVDSAVGAAASKTSTVTGTNIAAGEYVGVWTPAGAFKVTAVASGAVDGDGTFNTSATAATCATNIKNALNSLAGFSRYAVATTSTADLIVTAVETGAIGNKFRLVDGTVNGLSASGAFTGGVDQADQVTSTIALVHAAITADDTTSIGCVTLTWKASASGEDQVTIGADVTEDGDNLAAKINAHSKLAGLVSAVNDAGTITITHLCDPRNALHYKLAVSDGTTATLTQPASTLTLASAQAGRTYSLGAA
jgi:hypothetical protein